MEGRFLSINEQRITISDDSSSRQEPFVNNNYFSTDITYKLVIASMSLDFVTTLAQIITAIVLVTQAKGDPLEANWIVAYTFGCVAYLPVICWAFWQYTNDFPESGINSLVVILKPIVDYFFTGWCLVFIWVLDSNLSSMDTNTPLFKLSVAFLAYSFIRYVLPILTCAMSCCCASVMLCFSGNH